MGCDRLVVEMYMTNPEPMVFGAAWGPWYGDRKRGEWVVEGRQAWSKLGDGKVRWEHKRWQNAVQGAVSVQFSPSLVGADGMRLIGMTLGQFGDVMRANVQRVDVAFDFFGRCRECLRLDPGACSITEFGKRRGRAAQTELVGHKWPSRFQAQLYDKTAERAARGKDAVANWLRFEVRRLSPFPVVGEAEARSIKLADLPHLAWLVPESVVCREFVRAAGDYQDKRYQLLADVAFAYGTKAAEDASALVLGVGKLPTGDYPRDQLRGCMWPEVEPSPAAVFAARWPREAFGVLDALRAGAAAADRSPSILAAS